MNSGKNESQSVYKTLEYFNNFKYAPTFVELHTFLEQKISSKTLKTLLETLEIDKKVIKKQERYTLGEYAKNITTTVQKEVLTAEKKGKIKLFISVISRLPFIQLVGYSGSVAMNNAEPPDDIDIFIISRAKKMWITRLVSVGIAELLNVRRKRGQLKAKDTVCLNMFMDERDVTVPFKKKTLYVAHEVLQLKPILNRNNTYEKFLTANNWVFTIFPNAQKYYILDNKSVSKNIKSGNSWLDSLSNFFELLAKLLQLHFIQKHKTSERITDTQLWFFPDDYEKKLTKRTK